MNRVMNRNVCGLSLAGVDIPSGSTGTVNLDRLSRGEASTLRRLESLGLVSVEPETPLPASIGRGKTPAPAVPPPPPPPPAPSK